MKYRKVIPFKLKNILPMAAITGSTIFFGACHKKPLPEPHHNTTYVWGIENWDAVWHADKVVASADSTSVDYVFLQNDGNSLEGLPTTWVLKNMNNIIESVPLENQYKIRGAGTLNDIYVHSDQMYLDSIALAQMGFKFGTVYHNGYKHR